METILRTNNLSKKYGGYLAVNNVNMQISKGDIYGFVGKNGAGKTTLIRLITGLIQKNSGGFTLFGVDDDSKEIDNVRQRISAVVETPSLYLNMSAYDNLKIQAMLFGINKEGYIEELLEKVGLNFAKTSKKKVKDYSLGMRQRLAIAISLISNPEFIILDEPMNGLDPQGIVEVRDLLLKLNREKGLTILISSHILGELSRIATRYGFIDEGKIIKEIEADELEEKSRQYIKVSVDDRTKAEDILKNVLKVERYELQNKNHICIFDEIEITTIVNEFAKANINITGIQTVSEDVEDYFINLIGGLK